MVEKWAEGYKYNKQGLERCPDDVKLKEMKYLFEEALTVEKKCADEVASIKSLKEDKKLEMYRFLRSKKLKIGKKIELFEQLPDNLELNVTKDKDDMLHFPVFLLYD